MMLIIVEADSDVSTFEQVIIVPCSPSLVALTIRLDTRGRLFCGEVLAKVNMVVFTRKF